MLNLQSKPLPESQVKAIKEWLREPPARAFVDWLAHRAAAFTAEAGNALVESDLAAAVEANNAAEEARKFVAVHEIMVRVMTATDNPFSMVEIKPKPLTE